MLKRSLYLLAAVVAVASALAFTVSPVSPQAAWAAITAAPIKEAKSTPAPKNAKKALKILHKDVKKLAHDYAHKRYRAVCADLTAKERKHFGGTSECMLAVALINHFVPIKKFTITAAKLAKSHAQGAVSLFVNGNKKHRVRAVVKWEGGRYRLDHQSGWHPKI
jgi:hypothetical protein